MVTANYAESLSEMIPYLIFCFLITFTLGTSFESEMNFFKVKTVNSLIFL